MYFKVDNGILAPAKRGIEIDTSKYKVQINSKHFQLSADDQHHNFLIDFGISQSKRNTVICDNAGEMLHILALIKMAFG